MAGLSDAGVLGVDMDGTIVGDTVPPAGVFGTSGAAVAAAGGMVGDAFRIPPSFFVTDAADDACAFIVG
eukprot:CAMPEP_0198124658 /NCGR_PEP_ID=MMETSP1442-20131203/40526_1 /TAXON_ID= /ORGANISM="Craspedostauros australis, Strain CCMP3328" /LENGTH=68 /DNA_ID=CAMNT_0043784107 /DNA_START=557 /DNA_END=760 /DNA_ORIENTATION=+